MNKQQNKKAAFTLAEVLITLGIIGVVAAMTIPVLIQNYREKAIVTEAKKAYSEFSQAFQMAITEEGTPENWGFSNHTDTQGNIKLYNMFKPYLKIAKECEPENNTECFKASDYTFNNQYVKKGILTDGIKFYMYGRDGGCNLIYNYCAVISILPKKANAELRFWITKNKIIPEGYPGEWTLSGIYSFKDCYTTNHIGGACTGWIIYNENLDFMRCKDELSWSGKHKCN